MLTIKHGTRWRNWFPRCLRIIQSGNLAILHFSTGPFARALQLRILLMNLVFVTSRSDSGVLIKRTRLIEFLTDAAIWCSGGWKSGSVTLRKILESWRLLRPGLKDEARVLKARVPLIRCLFENRDGSIPLKNWIGVLYISALKEAFEAEPGLADEYETFKNLYALTKEGKPLDLFTVEIFANQGRSKNQVNLITLHSSKGLEFQGVVMVGLELGDFPSQYATGDDEIEEAARLFYVGVTRAKSEVHLLYAHNESPLITAIRKSTA